MSSTSLLVVDNLSKKFCRSLKRSMAYGLQDVVKDCLQLDHHAENLRKDEFWALSDVAFELTRGECLGLIGANGAGKSTLLKILAGVIKPDVGKIGVRGNVGSLLEVGAGFHPMLSGRENVYLNGTILGMSKRYIDECFDSIVEFAELEDAIDMAIKNYSSGMYVRLGFAIATKMRADVVLLDEILAVGDVKFQAKCFNAINNLLDGSAVVFVSHSMAQISRVCSSVGYLEKGQYRHFDVTSEGIDHYFDNVGGTNQRLVTGSEKVRLVDFEVCQKNRNAGSKIEYAAGVLFKLSLDFLDSISSISVVVSFYSSDMRLVAQCNSYYNGQALDGLTNHVCVTAEIEKLCLSPGRYSISVGVMSENAQEVYCRVDNVVDINVSGSFIGYAPVQFVGDWRSRKLSHSKGVNK